jgi:tetratricopeptide (TPR) repeat protein
MIKYTFKEDINNFLSEAEDLFQLNNLLEALNLAKERLQSFPLDVNAHIVACKAFIYMERPDDAREALRDVGEIISGLTLVYERVGDIYREKGFNQDAAACYEKVLSLHPEAENAREVIGKMALLDQDEDPVSVTATDIVNNENIREPEFFTTTLAELYIKQGHLHDAEIILEEVIKKEPQNMQAMSMLDELKETLLHQSSSNDKFSRHDNLIRILSSWLKNIERFKNNASGK